MAVTTNSQETTSIGPPSNKSIIAIVVSLVIVVLVVLVVIISVVIYKKRRKKNPIPLPPPDALDRTVIGQRNELPIGRDTSIPLSNVSEVSPIRVSLGNSAIILLSVKLGLTHSLTHSSLTVK